MDKTVIDCYKLRCQEYGLLSIYLYVDGDTIPDICKFCCHAYPDNYKENEKHNSGDQGTIRKTEKEETRKI